MEYPKTDIEAWENRDNVTDIAEGISDPVVQFGKWSIASGRVGRIIAYAKWAHEQLRPRKVSEERPKIGQSILWLDSDNHWYGAIVDETRFTHYTWWMPAPPPPKPDKFEEWWKKTDLPNALDWRAVAKCAWNAAKKAYGVEE